MSKTAITAHDSETLDSVLFRAKKNTNGIEQLLMSDAEYAQKLVFQPGQNITITADIMSPPQRVTTTITLWE